MADTRVCEEGKAQVSIISKEMVVPAKATERQSYFLSCFDMFWRYNHYNQRVLFYDERVLSGQEDGRAVMERLKESLARCLVHYYPWCGRLCAGDRLFIDCNDAGVEFVEASLDLPISLLSLHGFQMKPFFEHLCQKVDHSGDSLYTSPLLSIQERYRRSSKVARWHFSPDIIETSGLMREYYDTYSLLLLGLFGCDPDIGMLLYLGFYELAITYFKDEGHVHLKVYCVGFDKPDNAKLIGCGGYEDYRFRVYRRIAFPLVSRMDWHVGVGADEVGDWIYRRETVVVRRLFD